MEKISDIKLEPNMTNDEENVNASSAGQRAESRPIDVTLPDFTPLDVEEWIRRCDLQFQLRRVTQNADRAAAMLSSLNASGHLARISATDTAGNWITYPDLLAELRRVYTRSRGCRARDFARMLPRGDRSVVEYLILGMSTRGISDTKNEDIRAWIGASVPVEIRRMLKHVDDAMQFAQEADEHLRP